MIYFTFKDTNRLNMEEWKEIFHANSNEKMVVWLHLEKIYFKQKLSKNTRRSLYNDKRVNSSKEYKNYNGHAPEFQTFKYIKEMLTKLKRKIDSDTVVGRKQGKFLVVESGT